MKNAIERAISIRQPYPELIFRGVKKNEFRSRSTNIRERVYHASGGRDSSVRSLNAGDVDVSVIEFAVFRSVSLVVFVRVVL